MSDHDFASYSPPLIALLIEMPLAPLGPGQPHAAFLPRLEALDVFPGTGLTPNRAMAACCQAGLWLGFNFLEESHEISQTVSTAEGSFWHAIMHRREPDPSNSKYWWRKVASHPVLDMLREQTPALGYQFTDPYAFVDLVEKVRDTDTAEEEMARRVQKLEWVLLFHWCFCRAFPG